MNLSDEEVRILTDSFSAIKSKYEQLVKDFEQQKHDANEFAAHTRERLGALGTGRPGGGETLGSHFIGTNEFKTWLQSRQPGQMRWERPEGLQFSQKTITNATVPIPPEFGGLVPFAHAPANLRQILPIMQVRQNSVEYMRAHTKTVTGSIIQATEGAVKASADWAYEPVSAAVVTFAETGKVSVQAAEDVPGLRQSIDEELMAQVQAAEENEILNGPGGSGRMDGFLHLAPAFSGGVSGDKSPDLVLRAIAQLQAAGYTVSGVVLNPADAVAMALLKDTLGRTLYGATFPWSVQTVTSAAMPAGQFLTGAFRQFSALLDRAQSIEVGWVADDFSRNLLTIRVDLRSGLIIKRPTGFLQGSLTPPA